ncbi:MAG: hypothetical protein JW924_03140 [Fusobacteriaceae bacterium]|nr:hypothetical protein [Fusobacteriaceae bacterium]
MITRKDVNFELRKGSELYDGKKYNKETKSLVDISKESLVVELLKGILKLVAVAVKIALSSRTNQLRIMKKLEVPLLEKRKEGEVNQVEEIEE